MRERWVRPPLVAREPAPHWRQVWPFRVVVVLLAVAATVGIALAWSALNDAPSQDPGVEALSA